MQNSWPVVSCHHGRQPQWAKINTQSPNRLTHLKSLKSICGIDWYWHFQYWGCAIFLLWRLNALKFENDQPQSVWGTCVIMPKTALFQDLSVISVLAQSADKYKFFPFSGFSLPEYFQSPHLGSTYSPATFTVAFGTFPARVLRVFPHRIRVAVPLHQHLLLLCWSHATDHIAYWPS